MGLNESLNKGIPVWAPVDVKVNDLVEIADDKDAVLKIVNKYFEKYMDFLGTLTRREDIEYFQTMSAVVDPKTLERKIVFSPNGYFSTLALSLNLDNICNNFDGTTQIVANGDLENVLEQFKGPFKERIDVLRTVKKPQDLCKNFPVLYRKFQQKETDYQQIRQLYVTFNNKTNGLGRKQKRALIKQFNNSQRKTDPGFDLEKKFEEAFKFNVSTYAESCARTFTGLVDNGKKVLDYIYSHPIDLGKLPEMDKDKFELYLAGQFLEMAEKVDDSSKQDYLYYVSDYFSEHKDLLDSDLSIVVGDKKRFELKGIFSHFKNGEILTPRSLYERYRQLLVDNPDLRAIDFSHLDFKGMTAYEVKTFMDEYLTDLSANWDFLPPDDKSYENEAMKKIRESGQAMSEEEREQHQLRLLDLFMEKKELYDSSDPFFRVKGKETFDGYIGFVYPNGRVVLDKFYDDADSGKLADGHAVYAMSIQDFYELSKLSKSEIIRNKLCHRYIHKGDWSDKVLKREIMADTGMDPTVEVKELVKKGDIVKPESTDEV